ncbi:MAG: hypothetical protein CXZ00_16910 [Acidobacteria bacterium]|nr:MAG: hypothetical protein CXZ00_16910 [Acidobacteriota bacterium]
MLRVLGQLRNAPCYFRAREARNMDVPAVAADGVGLAEGGEAVFGRIANVFRNERFLAADGRRGVRGTMRWAVSAEGWGYAGNKVE